MRRLWAEEASLTAELEGLEQAQGEHTLSELYDHLQRLQAILNNS